MGRFTWRETWLWFPCSLLGKCPTNKSLIGCVWLWEILSLRHCFTYTVMFLILCRLFGNVPQINLWVLCLCLWEKSLYLRHCFTYSLMIPVQVTYPTNKCLWVLCVAVRNSLFEALLHVHGNDSRAASLGNIQQINLWVLCVWRWESIFIWGIASRTR